MRGGRIEKHGYPLSFFPPEILLRDGFLCILHYHIVISHFRQEDFYFVTMFPAKFANSMGNQEIPYDLLLQSQL